MNYFERKRNAFWDCVIGLFTSDNKLKQIKCSKCKRVLSKEEINMFLQFRDSILDGNNKYTEDFQKPYCIKCFVHKGEVLADKISRSQGKKEIGLNTKRKGE